MNKFLACGAAAAAIIASGAAVASVKTAPAAPAARGARATQPLTRTQVEARIDAAFAKLDTNHDGFITKDEVSAMVAQRQQKMEQRAEHFDSAKVFDHFDLNHDGKITTAEVDSVRDKRAKASGSPAQQAHADGFRGWFARADANKDGTITRAEFDTIAPQIKARIEHAGISRDSMMNRMFGMEDTNKDGRVSLAEMKQAALARFDRVDLNHDGTITPQERQKAAQMFKAQHPKN
jgi:Ca2+-binding EF-hand superfamily protein